MRKFFDPELRDILSLVVVDEANELFAGYRTACCNNSVPAYHGRTLILFEQRAHWQGRLTDRVFYCRGCMIKTLLQLEEDSDLPVDEEIERRIEAILRTGDLFATK